MDYDEHNVGQSQCSKSKSIFSFIQFLIRIRDLGNIDGVKNIALLISFDENPAFRHIIIFLLSNTYYDTTTFLYF